VIGDPAARAHQEWRFSVRLRWGNTDIRAIAAPRCALGTRRL